MSIRRIESFLLRLVVLENGQITPEQWRGRIQHVASGKECQIEQLEDVVSFIATHLDEIEMVKLLSDQPS